MKAPKQAKTALLAITVLIFAAAVYLFQANVVLATYKKFHKAEVQQALDAANQQLGYPFTH